MIQLGMWAHTLVTLLEGQTKVAGFEAKPFFDDLKRKQVLNYSSPGICIATELVVYQKCPYTTVIDFL